MPKASARLDLRNPQAGVTQALFPGRKLRQLIKQPFYGFQKLAIYM